MLTGQLIREKVNCTACGRVSVMSCGKKRTAMHAYFADGKNKLCRSCAKKLGVV